MSARPIGDQVLVRRAAREVAVQVAALVAIAMLLLVVLVTIVVVRGQAGAADDLLRNTLRTADDVGDPPSGIWLVMDTAKGLEKSAGLPDELDAALAGLRGTARCGSAADECAGGRRSGVPDRHRASRRPADPGRP